ncbi:MAG TPA: hypothetical protein VM578_02205 [Candidatus Saccharimonadales bacterium]|nr:hypothetical protein [Candidatus Saccharimonadales bacterium]
MRFTLLLLLALATSASASAQSRRIVPPKKFPIGGSAPSSAQLKIPSDLAARIAQWKPVDMPFSRSVLSARDLEMIDKLVDASRHLDSIYWRQSDPYALTLQAQLKGVHTARDQQILRYLFINGGQYDLLDNNRSFITAEPAPPGRGFYPVDATRESVESYASAHPESRAELYSPYTLVRAMGSDIVGLPYRSAFRAQLIEAAKDLREAAILSDDPDFAAYLQATAEALLNDDYSKSDQLWLSLKSPKIDLIFAPYLVYLDQLLGVKNTYSAAILIRDDEESRKLDLFRQSIPQIQQSLPLDPEDKPAKDAQTSPMEVVDSPFRAGDLLHGYQAVAASLPPVGPVNATSGVSNTGTKKIFFKNFMDARVNHIILPIARKLMDPSQSAAPTANGYLTVVILHEISHDLGPTSARVQGRRVSIREAIGPAYSALEEAKADVTGMYGLHWLIEHNVLPREREPDFDASYLAGILRSVRFGPAEAHARAQLMEFNYLLEKGAITPHAGTLSRGTARVVFAVDYEKLPTAIASLNKELLEIEATGDRPRAEQWFARYSTMPPSLKASLESTKSIPIDIFPKFSWDIPIR